MLLKLLVIRMSQLIVPGGAHKVEPPAVTEPMGGAFKATHKKTFKRDGLVHFSSIDNSLG